VTVGGVVYGDWYLPSKHELPLLCAEREAVGGFITNNYYWSSSEYAYHSAWSQYFGNGYQEANGKTPANAVRAVRAF